MQEEYALKLEDEYDVRASERILRLPVLDSKRMFVNWLRVRDVAT